MKNTQRRRLLTTGHYKGSLEQGRAIVDTRTDRLYLNLASLPNNIYLADLISDSRGTVTFYRSTCKANCMNWLRLTLKATLAHRADW